MIKITQFYKSGITDTQEFDDADSEVLPFVELFKQIKVGMDHNQINSVIFNMNDTQVLITGVNKEAT